MRFLLLFLVIQTSAVAQQADWLITNVQLIDGSGAPASSGELAIKDGKILAVGPTLSIKARQTLNGQGMVLAPGFIDVHTHTEGDEHQKTDASSFLYDGVTTVITGNCGSSRIDLQHYLPWLDSLGMGIHIGSLVGHNDVRRAIMGRANRPATEAELQRMDSLIAVNMRAGAFGLSTGLIYIPGAYAPTEEIVRLAKVARQYGGLYATHMRSEGDSVVPAILEALTIGRQAEIPVEISHFKVSGQQNWGRSRETLALVEAARSEGLRVSIDQYPYTASSTSLSTLLPDWALADGQDSINARIAHPETHARIKEAMLANLTKRRLDHFSFAVVAYYRADTTRNGRSIEQINRDLGMPHHADAEAETILDMMIHGGASMVFHGMSEDDVAYLMKYPHNMVASDADIRIFGQGNPHPRGYGTNARVLGLYVRDKKVISLEEAIRRMTALPAATFGIRQKGLLQPGMDADLVLFDPALVSDLATFETPHQYSKGFHYVWVLGQPAIVEGRRTAVRAGRTIKKG